MLVLENYLIYLTPGLPHNLDLMHSIAVYLFYAHFGLITVYRTIILGAHLYKKEHVREVLMESAWKTRVAKPRSISGITPGTSRILVCWTSIKSAPGFAVSTAHAACIGSRFEMRLGFSVQV